MHRIRTAAATAVGAALIAGLTACSGGSGSDGGSQAVSPEAALKKASVETGQQQSARVDGVTAQGTAQGTMRSLMRGVMDWSEGGTQGDMTVRQQGGATSGTPMDGKTSATRYTADAMYVNMGAAFAAAAGDGAHWIKYDYDKLAEQGGASGAFIKDQMQNNNPARSVELLLATPKVKRVGEETVRGTRATHYRGTLEVAELTRMQSKELSESDLRTIQRQMESAGLTTETIDLWIDENDLLVKKREVARSSKGAEGSFDSTVYYTDYGTQVTIEAPPAADTIDFDKVS